MKTTRALLLPLLLVACGTPRVGEAPDDDATAAALARDGHVEDALDAIDAMLANDPTVAQELLLDPSFAGPVRQHERFESAVGRALFEATPHHVTLAPEGEPGEWVEVTFVVVDASGAPVPGAEVFVFATDAEGRYHPTIEGEAEPRLWGCTTTGDDGRCSIRTVRPGPYPGTRNPRHLHVRARKGALRLAVPGYVVFDDDPLLFEPGNEEPRGEAARIAMEPTSGDVARGTVVLPLR